MTRKQLEEAYHQLAKEAVTAGRELHRVKEYLKQRNEIRELFHGTRSK